MRKSKILLINIYLRTRADRNQPYASFAANANYLRGNYDLADDYIINYKPLESLEGVLLSAQISWDRGSKIAAMTKMEYSIEKFLIQNPFSCN